MGPGFGAGGGRWSDVFSRLLENPDNPLGWSVLLFRVWGIAVRVHLLTLLFVGFMLAWSIPPTNAGVAFMALAMGALLLVVLAHELGHCAACRWVGGSADRIVLLPMGGLPLTRPPESWTANLITALGGPAVNVALAIVTSLALWAVGLGQHIVFNPFRPLEVIADPAFASASNAGALARVGLWWAHYANLAVLGLNVLVPAFPLDGGRLLQAGLWSRWGYTRATELVVLAGIFSAMLLAVLGLVAEQSLLVVLAALVGWACWTERKRLRAGDELTDPAALSLGSAPVLVEPDTWALRRAEKARDARERELAGLDAVLEKISRSGMESLSKSERAILERATKAKRGGER